MFDNLASSIVDTLGGPVLDELAIAFQDAIFFVLNIMDDLKSSPDKVRKGIKLLIKTLKGMFKIGMSMVDMLVKMMPFIEKVIDFVSSDLGKKIIGWTAAILAASWAATGFYAVLSKLIIGTVSLGTSMLGVGTKIVTATGLLGKFGLAGAAAFAGWGIGSLLMEIKWVNDAMTDLMDTLDLFGRHNAEQIGIDAEAHGIATREATVTNLRILGKTEQADKLEAELASNKAKRIARGEGDIYNIVNHINVTDPVTGEDVKEFVNGRP
jgi:hypothetical protein